MVPAEAARQTTASPAAAPTSKVAATIPSPAVAAPSSPVVAVEKNAGGSEMQQGGDSSSQQQAPQQQSPQQQPPQQQPSQQQDDAAGTATRSVMPTEAKTKIAEMKQDDSAAGAIQDHASDAIAATALTSFPDQARAVTQSETAAPTPAPFQGTAEALRTSEPNVPEAPQVRTGAAQEISIRISQADAPAVDLRVSERAGQVHVDVRAADTGLQTSLRSDLGTLTGSLEKAGYHSETFTPSSTVARAASGAQAGNQDDRQDSQNRGGSGDFSGGRRQQQQQKRPSTWLEEMEDSK